MQPGMLSERAKALGIVTDYLKDGVMDSVKDVAREFINYLVNIFV